MSGVTAEGGGFPQEHVLTLQVLMQKTLCSLLWVGFNLKDLPKVEVDVLCDLKEIYTGSVLNKRGL